MRSALLCDYILQHGVGWGWVGLGPVAVMSLCLDGGWYVVRSSLAFSSILNATLDVNH